MNQQTQLIKDTILEFLKEEELFTHSQNQANKQLRIDAEQTYLRHMIRDEIDRMVKLINKSLKAKRRSASSCNHQDVLRYIQSYELAKKAKLGTG